MNMKKYKGAVRLMIEDKVVATGEYISTAHRQNIIGRWYAKYQLQKVDFILTIIPNL